MISMTYARCSTKINYDFALLQETILFIKLDQLESSTSSIALLFRQLIPFIQTAFAMLVVTVRMRPEAMCEEGSRTFFWIAMADLCWTDQLD